MSALLQAPQRSWWQKLLAYREYWGDRIAWKVGNLTRDEDGEPSGYGQFSVSLDVNVDSDTFKDYQQVPWRVLASYLDHSLSVVAWRWGIWIAVRGRKIEAAS